MKSLILISIFLTVLTQPGSQLQSSVGQFASALKKTLAHPSEPEQVRISLFCPSDTGPKKLDLFSRGVGIWQGRVVFDLPAARFRKLLQAIEQAGFVHWNTTYGQRVEAERAPARIVASLQVQVGDLSRRVVQFDRGEQFAPLFELSRNLVKSVQPFLSSGRTIASFSEGLRGIAGGKLPPEAFRLFLHRRSSSDLTRGGEETKEFTLRVEGLQGAFDAGRPEEETHLSLFKIRDLARALASAELDKLPASILSEGYIDLSVTILDQRKAIQARQFSRLEADPSASSSLQSVLQILHDFGQSVQNAPK